MRRNLVLFFDENGSEVVFNAGQTWIEIVPEGTKVDFDEK